MLRLRTDHEAPPLARSATIGEVDATKRTFTAVISTDSPVMRRDGFGAFGEILSHDATAVDLAALRGAPVLDGHAARSVTSILGRVADARIEGGQVVASIELAPDQDALAARIAGGFVRNVSIGYEVAEWRDGRATDGSRTRTAMRWSPREVSLVPLPADRGTGITMDRGETNRQIRSLARQAGQPAAVADGLIDRGADLDEARADILTRVSTAPAITRVIMDHSADDPQRRAEDMADGLATRAFPGHTPGERGRAYAHMTLRDAARDTLTRAGYATTGLGDGALLQRALASTSDFPFIIGNVMSRGLRRGYASAEPGIRTAARQAPNLPDFRRRHMISFSAFPQPLPVGEGGEYQRGILMDGEESYGAARFGRTFGLTIEALVNDDIGVFGSVPQRMGLAWADFQALQLAALLTAGSGLGPVMNDGQKLFNVAHGNVAGTAGALSAVTLSAARLAMRRQKGLQGETLGIAPRYLVVPPELETTAQQLLSGVQAAKTADVNPFTNLVLLVEPRLVSVTRWYLAADPAVFDGLEWAVVEGLDGPRVETVRDFDTEGVKMRVSGTFGAGFIDFRGWFTNAGT